MKRLVAVLSVALVLSGCATQQLGPGEIGERIEHVGSGSLYLATFTGDSNTNPDYARAYLVYRCAELAESLHKPFFILYDTLTNAARARPISGPVSGIVYGSPTVYAFVLPLDERLPGAEETSVVLEALKKVGISGKHQQSANGQNK